MKAIRVHVEAGRITGMAPAGLPDGDLDLCMAEPEDGMAEDEFVRVEAALARGVDSIGAGNFRPANAVIATLRTRAG